MFIILHIFIPHVEIRHSHSKQMKMSCQICCCLIFKSQLQHPSTGTPLYYLSVFIAWFGLNKRRMLCDPSFSCLLWTASKKKLKAVKLIAYLNVHIDIKICNILNNCTYNSSYLLPCTVLQNNISLTVDRSRKTLVPESRKRQTQTYSKSLLIIINNITIIAVHGLE